MQRSVGVCVCFLPDLALLISFVFPIFYSLERKKKPFGTFNTLEKMVLQSNETAIEFEMFVTLAVKSTLEHALATI